MVLVVNKKAKHDFEISQTFMAGIVLFGHEVKSLRGKNASLKGSYVKIIDDEAFLINAQVNPYKFASLDDYDPKRTRKLLLNRKEIYKLSQATARKGWSLVPLSIETVGKNIKLKIGLGRGKKEFEKRALLRQKDLQRDVEREVKSKVRMT